MDGSSRGRSTGLLATVGTCITKLFHARRDAFQFAFWLTFQSLACFCCMRALPVCIAVSMYDPCPTAVLSS